MGDGFQALDIILFAMIAAFLVLRLRSVLGKRTGHERRRPSFSSDNMKSTSKDDKAVEIAPAIEMDSENTEDTTDSSDPIATGLSAVREVDPTFDTENFISGAKAAFEIVVNGFASGDKGALRGLLNNEVFENFCEAIDEREAAGNSLETVIVGIKEINVLEARVDRSTAFVTVKVLSEQVNVTRENSGTVVDGDENRVAPVIDIWTFARNTRAHDPNWTLVETRSPQ
ncbi:MAG: translocase [Rhodospirillaceae bacterium]|nr:translocase [Rhodospirillaceae bacterium]|tara:strand:+ start:411 stop:1094 length:684 start_codon:yes stop_codon:yes gene_type:complete